MSEGDSAIDFQMSGHGSALDGRQSPRRVEPVRNHRSGQPRPWCGCETWRGCLVSGVLEDILDGSCGDAWVLSDSWIAMPGYHVPTE